MGAFRINFLSLIQPKDFILPCAGLLCFLIYHCFKLEEGWWSVATVALIYNPKIDLILLKTPLRILGSLCGLSVGYVLFHYYSPNMFVFLIGLFLTGFLSSLCALIFQEMTDIFTIFYFNVLIFVDFVFYGHLKHVYLDRVFEVCLGVGILALSYILYHLILYPKKSLFKFQDYQSLLLTVKESRCSMLKVKGALIITTTVMISILIGLVTHNVNAFWSAIVILFFLQDRDNASIDKFKIYFLGDISALLVSGMLIYFFPGQFHLFCGVLFLWLWLCAKCINYGGPYSKLGSWAGISLSVLLLTNFPNQQLSFLFARFGFVFLGIALSHLALRLCRSSFHDG
jgi:uncharacterized membrane protein YccC